MATKGTHLPAQRRKRTADGLLIVNEGMPDRWHYELALEDNPKLNLHRGRITVMFDGHLRCHLTQLNLAEEEEEAVAGAREKVLAWIADYEIRNGPAEPSKIKHLPLS